METSLLARLHVVAWPDSVIDRLGFPPQSPYSGFCWLPRLGPSATVAYRRLAGTLTQRPDGFDVDCRRAGWQPRSRPGYRRPVAARPHAAAHPPRTAGTPPGRAASERAG